ncbi:MAG: ATP-binding cassette domain-containing protein [Clostridiaceae bacterium]|nr:ATP-binding cassette domain-containing protein [Clostridiaceae bacterium]
MGIGLHNINKRFGELEVLNGFSLELPETGIIGLSGPSGCGKTTMLRILAGLESSDEGYIDGLDGKRISMVFQEDRLLPWMNLIGNLLAVQKEAAIIRYYLEALSLTEQAYSYPHELSGGMQRRAALARALAYGGDIFILDEPFKGLDRDLKDSIFPHINDLGRNSLVLIVSHETEDLKTLADQILMLSGLPMKIQKRGEP